MFGFVEVLVGEANRKCFDWARTGAGHERNHSGGVNPSAEQCSERDIAEQPNPNGLGKSVLQFFQTFFLGSRRIDSVGWEVPILADADLTGAEFEQVSRGQLVDPLESSMRVHHITEVEITKQCIRVNVG